MVDLFAAQAILPQLARLYDVSATKIGLAVNSCTIGMAIAGPVASVSLRGVSRRAGIWLALTLLLAPTCTIELVRFWRIKGSVTATMTDKPKDM